MKVEYGVLVALRAWWVVCWYESELGSFGYGVLGYRMKGKGVRGNIEVAYVLTVHGSGRAREKS